MSRFSWGGRVVVDKKKLTNQLIAFVFNKTNLTKLLLLGWQSKGEFYWLLRCILLNIFQWLFEYS
jgi:hypothetical protein